MLTPKGEAFLKDIPGVSKSKTPNENSETYVVPLADRKIVGTPFATRVIMPKSPPSTIGSYMTPIPAVIMDGDRVVGMFTTIDALQALAHVLGTA